jgi:aryl-alcohol dehydrogenase-like predicted oxidoreductase
LKKVRLGKTGLMASRVGIGCIPIKRPPLDEAVKVINRALGLGVNLTDTAFAYGDNEVSVNDTKSSFYYVWSMEGPEIE